MYDDIQSNSFNEYAIGIHTYCIHMFGCPARSRQQ